MAEGVRVRHRSERSCRLVLVDASRAYVTPQLCPACHTTHTFKTYHLDLDETGAVIVSAEIVERLKVMPDHGGFSVANAVAEPPAQSVAVLLPTHILDTGAPA